jgi:hypothetical protein
VEAEVYVCSGLWRWELWEADVVRTFQVKACSGR